MQDISSHPVVSLKMLCLSRVGRNIYMEYWTRKQKDMWDYNSSFPFIPKYFMKPLIRFIQIWSLPNSPTSGMLDPLLNTGSVTELELYFDLNVQKTWNLLEALVKHGKQFTSIKFYNKKTEVLGFSRGTLKIVPRKIKKDLHSLFLACVNLENLDIHVPFDIKVLRGNLKLQILTLRFKLSNIKDLIPKKDRPKGALHTLFVQDTSFKKHDTIMPQLLKAYPELKKVSLIHTNPNRFYPFPFRCTKKELNLLKLTWIEVRELNVKVLEFAEKSCPNLKILNFELTHTVMSQSLQDKLVLTGYSLGIMCYFKRIDGESLRFFEKLGNQLKRLRVYGFVCDLDVQKLGDLCPNLEYLKVTVLELRLFIGDVRRSRSSRTPYSKLKELCIMYCEQFVNEKTKKISFCYFLHNCKELEKLHLEHRFFAFNLTPACFFTDGDVLEVLRSNDLHNLKSCFLIDISMSLHALRCLLTSAKSLEKLSISTIEKISFDDIQSHVHLINPSIMNIWLPDLFRNSFDGFEM